MNETFEHKTVLVTGGSRGLGEAVCRRFAKEKCRVIINCAHNVSAAEKLALLRDFDRVLSLDLIDAAKARVNAEAEEATPASDDPLVAEIEAAIAERARAKKEKNYAEADRIRAELAARGITLIDTPNGTKFEIAK